MGLYGIAIDREASSKTALTRLGVGVGEVGMFISFGILIIGVGHKGGFSSYLGILYSFNRYWGLDEMEVKPRDFDIFSYYNQLQGSYSVVFPWKGIWKVKACVPFLVWTVAWNMELNSYGR